MISRKSEPNLPSKILEGLSQPGLQNLDAKYHPRLMSVKKMQHSMDYDQLRKLSFKDFIKPPVNT